MTGSEIEVILFDVGGVLLTNGWDRTARATAAVTFDLDPDEFDERHASIARDFETGKLTIDEYLDRTVFHRPRGFTRDEFVGFMHSRSEAKPGSLAVAADLAATGRYLMATLNNESRELNGYRIETFGLRDLFSVFLTSSYLGVAKPDPAIYRIAVDVTGSRPHRCVFIDDRELNLECAAPAGINPIHFTTADALRASLADLGVTT